MTINARLIDYAPTFTTSRGLLWYSNIFLDMRHSMAKQRPLPRSSRTSHLICHIITWPRIARPMYDIWGFEENIDSVRLSPQFRSIRARSQYLFRRSNAVGQSVRCPDCSRDEEQITAGLLSGSRKASQQKACCYKAFNLM